MLGRVTLVFAAAATLAVGAAGCSVSADVAALRDAGYGSSGGGYTSGSSSGGGTSSSSSSGGSSSGGTSGGVSGDDASPTGDDATPAGDDATPDATGDDTSPGSDDGGLDSGPAPDAPADAPLLVDAPPPPVDAPASDGLVCSNLGCFDVFDCAIYHAAEFGPCHFTACVNLVCQ